MEKGEEYKKIGEKKVKRIGLLLGIFLMGAILFACASKAIPVATIEEKPSEVAIPVAKSGWEAEWEKLKIEARKEGKIFVGSSGGLETRDALAGPLKEKFGLDLEWLTSPSSALIAKINAERRAGLFLFDVLITGPDTPYTVLRPNKVIVPLDDWLLLPEVTDPNAWLGGKLNFYDKEHTILTITATPTGSFLINTQLVNPGEIKVIHDLLNPKWKDKIVMHAPTLGGSGRRWSHIMTDITGGFDFLKQFVRQNPVLTDNHRLGAEWVAKGKYSIGVAIRDEDSMPFIEIGAPVAISSPSDGLYLASSGGNLMVLDRAPHPNVTRLFVNWLLSREGQIFWSRGSTDHSARVDIKPEELGIPSRKIRQPGVEYLNTLPLEYSSTRYVKEISDIFAPLLK